MTGKAGARFTPGPWRVDSMESTAKRPQEVTFAVQATGMAVEVANAWLIEAAPDLFEAARIAEQLAYIASDWNLDEVEIDGEMRPINEVRAIFTAAIAIAQPKASR